jgi:hypothetical protein
MLLFLPVHQTQLKKRTLIPAKTPLLQHQEQSNAARQTTPAAISRRILDIEGETELTLQEDSLIANLTANLTANLMANPIGNSGRGKKQTLHGNDIEAMGIMCRFYWLYILLLLVRPVFFCPYLRAMAQIVILTLL